jgi:hypothetical protein
MSEAVLSSRQVNALIVPPRFRYSSIVNQIAEANGNWVKLDPAEIHGRWPGEKQSILLQAGRLRGLRFETTFRCPPWLCVRLVKPESSTIDDATTAVAR